MFKSFETDSAQYCKFYDLWFKTVLEKYIMWKFTAVKTHVILVHI